MRVVITGGLGFIGFHLARRLASRGIPVRVLDDASSNGESSVEMREELARRKEELVSLPDVTLFACDIRDAEGVRSALDGFAATHVAHLAGLSRADVAAAHPERAFDANVVATMRLLEALSGAPPMRFVFASSSMVYGDFDSPTASEAHPTEPREPYGASKLAAEVLLREWSRRFGVECVVARLSAVYGPRDVNGRVVHRLLTAAVSGQTMTLSDGGLARLDFTWIDDAVDGLELALVRPEAKGETFNLTRGEGRSLAELAETIRAAIPEARIETRDGSDGRPRRGALDVTKARLLLGYEPRVGLEDGVTRLLALHGRAPATPVVPRIPVALSRPCITDHDVRAVSRVLRSGWLTHGPECTRFEDEVASYVGTQYGLALNSGTSALVLALRAAGIRGEVLVPSLTFPATANAVVLAGATPVFVDVEEATLGMDPDAARAAVTARTEAMIPVHYAGAPCRIEELSALARSAKLLLVEDAAQALGARVGSRGVGSFGVGCFSFFPTKNLTTGEGGMLVADDADLVRRARTLSAHGIPRGTAAREGTTRPWERRLEVPGYNFRMSEAQAALGRSQLARLDSMNSRRRVLAKRLIAGLAGTAVRPVLPRPGTEHVYSLFVVRVARPEQRDALALGLRASGIEASVHFERPVPAEAPYRGAPEAASRVASEAARSVLTLPLYPGMSDADADRVVSAVLEVAASLP